MNEYIDYWNLFPNSCTTNKIKNVIFTCIRCKKKHTVRKNRKHVATMKIVGPLRPAMASLRCAELNGVNFDFKKPKTKPKKKGVEVIE